MKKGVLLLLSFAAAVGLFNPPTAGAVTAADWRPGNIIADPVFFHSGSMSINDIQGFLNSRVPVCDTWGNKMHSSGMTRADYGRSIGVPPPYICVKDYHENPITHETNFNPWASIPAGGKSAAQIIYEASVRYNINPKVILVTIQKEAPENLLGDDWPWLSQYRSALGYGCPDTAPCDAEYYGFYNQVENSARQFRRYATYPEQYRYRVGQVNFIQYNPNSGCSGTNVFIETQATAGLYNYTPYQPNPAALANMYGTGDGCSAYGNRNFWRIWNDWFGPTSTNVPLVSSMVSTNKSLLGVGEGVNVRYTVTNPTSLSITVPSIGVSNRHADGSMYDFNVSQNINFAPHETKEFTGTFYVGKTGAYNLAVSYNYGSSWWVGGVTQIHVEKPSLSLTSPISVSPEFPVVQTDHEISFTVKNTGNVTACLTYLMAANMTGQTANGYTAASPVILNPGQSYTYSVRRNTNTADQQNTWVSYMLPTQEWVGVGNGKNWRTYSSPAQPVVTSPASAYPSSPVTGTDMRVSFTVKNTGDQPQRFSSHSLELVYPDSTRRTIPNNTSELILGGQERVFSVSFNAPPKGVYKAYASIVPTSDSLNQSLSAPAVFETYSSPTNIVDSSPLAPMVKKQGELVELKYTASNTGDQPTGPIQVAYYCRYQVWTYCDISGDSANLSYNATHTVSRLASFPTAGNYVIQPLKHHNGIWANYGRQVPLTVEAYTPEVITSLTLSKSSINLGETVTSDLSIKNNSKYTLQIPRYAVAARNNGFHDYSLNDWFILSPGETKSFVSQFTPRIKGTFQLAPTMSYGNTWYTYAWQPLTVN